MAQSVIHLTQSRFYSPAFNAAVFDGPIRIYFAQHQEEQALKIYFQLQQSLKELYAGFRKSYKQHGLTIFLMLYPNLESFEYSFGINSSSNSSQNALGHNVVSERLGDDWVLGVRGPATDAQCEEIADAVKAILQMPEPHHASPPAELAL